LAECYLAFLTHAQDSDGAFHNRLGHDRRWTDQPALGDWWGRALWGLGTAAARSPAEWIRTEALVAFTTGATRRSTAPRAMAFAGLGAAEILRVRPDDETASALLTDAAAVVGTPGDDPTWRWPHQRLTYANAALAEVLILAGHLGGDPPLLIAGLRMLGWLRDIQLAAGRLSVLPVKGWQRGSPRLRHDQQPIEVAAIADAAATAATVTGDSRWNAVVEQAIDWFGGGNDIGTPMWDPATGGGYDGLTLHGPNLNQGAESTLALISTMQHAR
ncbi:glycosyltransferase, partial [Virgisporangium ochraceum]|uniref:glycosyltransferase n=1 Tax=Virgisporangium ochraceum TaxID=65505 RepID=UPI00194061EF